jgi:uncharacterized protein (DUF2336 family)
MLVDGKAAAPAAANRISLADVQELSANRSPEGRAEFAAKFGRQYDGLVAGETKPLADAILQLLVRDLEQKVRQTLAETVAASPNLPSSVAGRLARDDVEIATPILEHSPVLSDEELGEIVRTHAMQYALAVAGRTNLSEHLSDVLATTGEADVVGRLVGNRGAQLSAATLEQIGRDYQGQRSVQDPLIRRPALPYELVDQMVNVIGERLEWELIRDRRMSPEAAQQLMAATRDRATLRIVSREHGEHSTERELSSRHAEGDLSPEDLLGFLRDGEIGRVEAALSVLADIEIVRVRQLLYGMDKRGLTALCIRSGFAVPHYVALRMALDLAEQGVESNAGSSGATYAADTIRFVQRQFEKMQADPAAVAQWFAS